MAVSIVILIILGILAAAASGEDAAGTKKMMVPFRKMGIWTAEKIKKYSFKDSGNRLKQDLTALEREEGYLTEEEYCARKLETAFFILFVGAGAAIFINIAVQETAEPVKESIERPAYGQGPAEEELEAVIEGEEEARQIPVTISPRAYTPSEVKSLLEDAVEEIDKSLSGQNKSLDEVRNTLNLQKTASGGAVTVEWSVIPYGVLDDNGKVIGKVPEEGQLLELSAQLGCQGEKAEYKAYAKVYPNELSEEEKLLENIRTEIDTADQNGIYEEELKLPQKVEGRAVTWKEEQVPAADMICLSAILGAIFLYVQKDSDIRKKAGKRRMQLILDYPQMLFKMSMLLGAGLTIREAFTRIAMEYGKKESAQKRYVYEEMLYSCGEMKQGVAEAEAYENFGKRCQETCYVKLGAVLAQHLKKGTKGLNEYLETEAINALEERRQMVQKMGEEAGTKLLIPMVLMLLLVLIILMVPAVMSF